MNLSIIAAGRMRDEPEAALFHRYAQRIRPSLRLTEVEDTKKLLGSVPRGAFVIALDEGGQAPDSVTFAQLLEQWLGSGRPVCFLIGGADGLDAAMLKRADATLSLGPLTWPHLLARVMLAEQIYRARAIAAGHPYHRAGRPDQ
jgi:23S rRNA (pseudouridine1915-N3)-methyltransferase